MEFLMSFLEDDQGQDLVEYALLISFVAVAGVAILTKLGTDISTFYGSTDSRVKAMPH
jgi:Flp pilus assembly pilin Flp